MSVKYVTNKSIIGLMTSVISVQCSYQLSYEAAAVGIRSLLVGPSMLL